MLMASFPACLEGGYISFVGYSGNAQLVHIRQRSQLCLERSTRVGFAVLGSSREPLGRRVGERLVPLLSSYQALVLLSKVAGGLGVGWVGPRSEYR